MEAKGIVTNNLVVSSKGREVVQNGSFQVATLGTCSAHVLRPFQKSQWWRWGCFLFLSLPTTRALPLSLPFSFYKDVAAL